MANPIKFSAPVKLPKWDTDERFELAIFNTALLNEALAENDACYIAPEKLPEHDDRRFSTAIRRNQPLHMPIIFTYNEDGKQLVDFKDGRHHAAFLSKIGMNEIPAVILKMKKPCFMN
jgi:hypothetical protein